MSPGIPPNLIASPPLDRNSIAQIIFTSGTTAEPKGVVISHGNILANLEPLETAMQPYLKWERLVHPLRFLDLVPLSHVFGQFMGVWVPPLLGATVLFQDTLNPYGNYFHDQARARLGAGRRAARSGIAARQNRARPRSTEASLESFRSDFEPRRTKISFAACGVSGKFIGEFGWKFWAVISGGATLEPETEQFWGRIGFAAIQGYGLTETTSLVSVNHPFQIGRGSIGKVLPGPRSEAG